MKSIKICGGIVEIPQNDRTLQQIFKVSLSFVIKQYYWNAVTILLKRIITKILRVQKLNQTLWIRVNDLLTSQSFYILKYRLQFVLFSSTAVLYSISISSNSFPFDAFTASSYIISPYLNGSRGRKGAAQPASAWCPAHNHQQWLQIDLGSVKAVGAVGTEGWIGPDEKQKFVTQYGVSHGNDGSSWTLLSQVHS